MQAQPIRAFRFEASGHYGYAYNLSWDNDPAEDLEHDEYLTFKGIVFAKNEKQAERFITFTDFKPDWSGGVESIKLEEYEEDPDMFEDFDEGVVDFEETNQ